MDPWTILCKVKPVQNSVVSRQDPPTLSADTALLFTLRQIYKRGKLLSLMSSAIIGGEQGLCNGTVSVRLSVPAWTYSSKTPTARLSCSGVRRVSLGSATLSAYVGR